MATSVRSSALALACLLVACGGAPPAPPSPECSAWPISETARPAVHPTIPSHALRDEEPAARSPARTTLPVDWQTLPRTELLHRVRNRIHRAWIVGDVLLRDVGQLRLQANDLRTGAHRWTQASEWFRHAVGCEHAIQSAHGVVRAIDARTGEERWRRDNDESLAEPLGFQGCLVALTREMQSRDTPLEIWILDVATGTTVVRHELHAPGYARLPPGSSEVLVSLPGGRGRVAVPFDRGEPMPISQETAAVIGDLAIEIVDDRVAAVDRRSGATAWSRATEGRPELLARAGDDLVIATRGAFHRVALATGHHVWTLDVPEEATGDPAIATERHRMFVATDPDSPFARMSSSPPLLLEVDLDTGALRSMRIAPQGASGIAISGELAALWTSSVVSVVALDRERAPVRDTRSLRDEVRRALRALERPSVGYRPIEIDDYPSDPRWALAWLDRLRPIAREIVLEELLAASDADAAAWLVALEGDLDPRAHAVVVELLARTFAPITRGRIALRTAAARAVSRPLTPEVARALAESAIAWRADLPPEPAPTCDAAARPDALRDAIRASLAALERASTDPEPYLRARALVFPHRAPSVCTPSREDAAQSAAARYVIDAGVHIAGVDSTATCIDVRQPTGAPVARTADRYDALQVYAPSPLEHAARWLPPVGDPEWDEAPTVSVALGTGVSAQGESRTLVLRLVRGVWRVVGVTRGMGWTT